MNIITFLQKRWRWLLALAFIIYLINIIFYNTINGKINHDYSTNAFYPYYIINDTTSISYNFDSLPCNRIMEIKDSLKYAEDRKKMINDGDNASGYVGDDNFLWGTAYIRDEKEGSEKDSLSQQGGIVFRLKYKLNNTKDKDSIKAINKEIDRINAEMDKYRKIPGEEWGTKTRYFIVLHSYELIDSSHMSNPVGYEKTFIENNGRYFIRSIEKDSVDSNNKNFKICHYVYKEIPVKYVSMYKALLIRVSYKWYTIFKIVRGILATFVSLLFFYFVIFLSLKTVISISKGTPFTIGNIVNLRLTAYFLIVLPVLQVGIKHLLHLLFITSIPNEFAFTTNFNLYYFISGIAVYIIAKAFKRGYDLQKEQELTI